MEYGRQIERQMMRDSRNSAPKKKIPFLCLMSPLIFALVFCGLYRSFNKMGVAIERYHGLK
jgi:hypothetical protein